jgi:hypothetical protein
MALEIADMRDGCPISLPFFLANPAANATTAMTTFNQAATGFVVPTGFTFYPMAIFLSGNAAVAAGSIIAKVTDNTTVLAPAGPEATLNTTTTTRTAAVARRLQSAGVAAGRTIGVSLVADSSYAAATIDYDCVLCGVLVPV